MTDQKFIENRRILSDDMEGLDFVSGYLRSIAEKLLPDQDWDEQTIDFLVSDSDDISAFIDSSQNPPAIVVSKGLLELCETEDEIAFVLGHELSHPDFRAKYAIEDGKIATRYEEGTCDRQSVIWMEQAGYDWRQSISFFKKVASVQEQDRSKVMDMVDVHSSIEDRIKHIHTLWKGSQSLSNRSFNSNEHDATPKPAELGTMLAKAKHISFMDRVFEDLKFTELSVQDQLRALKGALKHLGDGYDYRGQQFIEALLAIDTDENPDQETMQAAQDLLDEALNKRMFFDIKLKGREFDRLGDEEHSFGGARGQCFNMIYRIVASRFIPRQSGYSFGLPVIGIFSDLQSKIDAFVMAQSPDEAISAAQDIQQFFDEYEYLFGWKEEISNHRAEKAFDSSIPAINISSIGNSLDFDVFPEEDQKIPSTELEPSPDHLDWASEPGNENIAEMLEFLGKMQGPLGAFVRAASPEQAKEAADRFHKMIEQLQASPEGFDINSLNIDWSIFPKSGPKTPWDTHLNWAEQDKTGVVFKTLWRLGLNLDQRLWAAQPAMIEDVRELRPVASQSFGTKQKLDHPNFHERNGGSRTYTFGETGVRNFPEKRLVEYGEMKGTIETKETSKRNGFQEGIDAWQHQQKWQDVTPITDDEALARFEDYFDQNLAALKVYEVRSWSSSDSDELRERRKLAEEQHKEAASKLLRICLKAIQSGTDEEKEIVRGFFVGRDDGRDIHHLNGAYTGTAFTNFALFQEYEGQSFDFFTLEERLRIDSKQQQYDQWGHSHYNGYAQYVLDDRIKNRGEEPQGTTRRRVFGYTPPQNREELASFYNRFKAHGLDAANEIAEQELLFFMANRKGLNPLSIDMAFILELMQSNDDYKPSRNRHTDTITYLINEFFEGGGDFNQAEDIKPEDFVRIYRFFDSPSSFRSFEDRKTLGDIVFQKIKEEGDLDKQRYLLEGLIFTRDKAPNAISDIELHREATQLWARNIAAIYGIDDGSETYQNRMADVLDLASEKSAKRDNAFVLETLAEHIEIQSPLAQAFKERLEMTGDDIINAHFPIVGAEELIKFFGSTEFNRKKAIDFLTRSLTDDSVQEIKNVILVGSNQVHSFISGDEDKKHGLDQRIRDIHTYFWQMSSQHRAIIVDYILLPAKDLMDDEKAKQAYEYAFELITDRLFEKDDPDADFAKSYLKTYLDESYDYQRSLLLSAMMTTNMQEEGAPKVSATKRLSQLLDNLGYAYTKLSQNIHSHPDTPEHIREEFKDSKAKADPIPQWEVWDLIDATLPDEVRFQIAHVGKVHGSASYNIAVNVTLKSGEEAILLLQRENAHENAHRGFDHLERTTRKNDHSRIDGIRTTLLDMITQADESSEIETDFEKGVGQQQNALVKYAGKKVKTKVDGQGFEFDFAAAPATHMGHGFKLLKKVEGVHFNDLPINTIDEKLYKRALAKSYFAMEIAGIVKGEVVDHDRHGTQMRVYPSTNKVGLFDFGGMMIDPPTSEEKQQLGKALSKMVVAGFRGDDFIKGLNETIEEIEDKSGSKPNYLMHIRKALLSLEDFRRELTTDDIRDIFLSILISGEFDPEIFDLGMLGTLTESFDGASSGLDIDDSFDTGTIVSQSVSVLPDPPKLFSDKKQKVSVPRKLSIPSSSANQRAIPSELCC